MSPGTMHHVVVHPLVLLSVVARSGKVASLNRVVGVLLGQWKVIDGEKIIDISNSFAVPYDEDRNDKTVWFLDHDYSERMYDMFKKVNARERIIGWYHTGPKLCHNDTAIHDVIKRYDPNCVLVITDVNPTESAVPTHAYISVEVHNDGSPTSRTFDHVPSEIGAEQSEEVVVEHLLRDVHSVTGGSLSRRITSQIQGLKGLGDSLIEIRNYLAKVVQDKWPNARDIPGIPHPSCDCFARFDQQQDGDEKSRERQQRMVQKNVSLGAKEKI